MTSGISLSGTPARIGHLWGSINAHAIAHDLHEHYLRPAKEEGISPEALIERSQRFVEIAGDIAPWWLEEAEAIAEVADVDGDLYVSFIAGVYRSLFLHPECTSYTVHGDFTQDHAIFFHKTRDNAQKAQSAYVLNSSVSGVNGFIAVSDASVVACMMMVNDKGLAGSADTGGLDETHPRYRGLMNTFILRFIAEKCACCEEALDTIQGFVAKGHYAGGERTGTHWLFVDREGTLLEVSHNAREVSLEYHTEKVYFSARGDSNAATTLRHAPSPIGFHTFHNVSRDPSMCFGSSIAGMTVEVSREHPDALTCAWISLPSRSLSFPVFMGQTSTPLCLLNGHAHSLGDEMPCSRLAWEQVEEELHSSRRSLGEEAANLLREQKNDQATSLLNEWGQAQAARCVALLDSMKEAGRLPT